MAGVEDRDRADGIDAEAVPRRWMAISLPWWPTDLVRRALQAGAHAAGRKREGIVARACMDRPADGDSHAVTDASRSEAPRWDDAPRWIDAAIIVHRDHRNAREVVAACPRAQSLGVRPGMPLAEAKAICGEGVVGRPWTPEADARALRRLARWCTRYAPLVMPDSGAGTAELAGVEPWIVVDVTGCELVHGGEASLLRRVRRELSERGVRAQVVIGPTQRAAIAAARASALNAADSCRVLDHDPRAAAESLAHLPLLVLGLSAGTLEALREVNVRRIGEVMRLPRREVADRFAPELLRALDELRGERAERFEPLPHARMIEVEISFDGPTTRPEAVAAAAHRSLERLCAKLARFARGARLIEVTLRRVDALPIVERITLGRASRHVRHLWSLMAPRLERVNMGFGVEGVSLRVLVDAPLPLEQRRWTGAMGAPSLGTVDEPADAEPPRQLAEMLDQVAARLGAEAMGQAEAWLGEEMARSVGAGKLARSDGDRPLRPTLLFQRAFAAEVVAEEAPGSRRPIEVRWPGGGGRVIECDGPERHAARWWVDGARSASRNGGGGAAAMDRDLWRVRTSDGRWLWLLHARPDRWSVVGAWT